LAISSWQLAKKKKKESWQRVVGSWQKKVKSKELNPVR
jgi:hypothetical protein